MSEASAAVRWVRGPIVGRCGAAIDLLRGDQHVETFWDEFTDVQLQVLDLLGIPAADYTR